jgi:hypothetical protein
MAVTLGKELEKTLAMHHKLLQMCSCEERLETLRWRKLSDANGHDHEMKEDELRLCYKELRAVRQAFLDAKAELHVARAIVSKSRSIAQSLAAIYPSVPCP